MKTPVSKSIILLAVFLSFLMARVQGANSYECKGKVISWLEGNATISLSEPSQEINIGDWAIVKMVDSSGARHSFRGSVIEIIGLDVVASFSSDKIEAGYPAIIYAKAPPMECDMMSSILGDEFAVSDGIRDEDLDANESIKACRAALEEYPNEPRLHAQLGRALEVAGKPASAILAYEKVLELEYNYPVSLHNLATIRFYGPEEVRDYRMARKLFKKAAELDYEASMPVLGSMCRDGFGGEIDHDAAAKWFAIAGERGNPFSQNALGECYENGWGVDQNMSKALLWYRSSAEKGSSAAMRNLGSVFADGKSVEQNEKKAFDWYVKSAKAGDVEAKFLLGEMHRYGRGTVLNLAAALELFNRAADQGYAKAMREIGTIYYKGEGTARKDYDLASAWYRKAAKLGDSISQFNLAVMLEKGQGMDRDKSKAISWYQVSARQGHDSSRQRLLKMQLDW